MANKSKGNSKTGTRNKKPFIFISHRHADIKIADVIKKHLIHWGINSKSIFQSSDPKKSSKLGEPLNEELKKALFKANVVLLIYTFSDEDWSFCMWETGVATDPKKDRNTRIIVFKCIDETPKVFEGQTIVSVTADDIKKFVVQFHKNDGFFPDIPAYQHDIEDMTIDKRTKELYEDLLKVLPNTKQEIFRWDNFRLEIDSKNIDKIKAEEDEEKLHCLITEKCFLVDDPEPFGNSLKHFGYDNFEDGLTLKNLIDRWQNEKQERHKAEIQGWEDVPDDWINEFCYELKRAIYNEMAKPPTHLMRSLIPQTTWWFHPIVNHVRHLPDTNMQFDVYFFIKP